MSRRGPHGPRREHFICVKCGLEKPVAAFRYACGVVAKRCTACRRTIATADAKAAAFVVQDGIPMTDNEVAAALGLTRQRVQQIETRALAKLRARAPWLLDMLRAS